MSFVSAGDAESAHPHARLRACTFFIDLALAIPVLVSSFAVSQSSSWQAKIAWSALSLVFVALMMLAWMVNLSVMFTEVSTT